MPSLARFTERSRAEWSGFQTAAAPHEPYNLESKPGHPRTIPQYRISFEICSILGRCAPPEFWAAKLGHVARMPGPRWAHRAQQRSLRNHVGADASPGIPGKSFYGLGHTKLGPHTLRFPARMQSPAGFTERSRTELSDSDSRPLCLGQKIWKTSLGLQKQHPNTEFHLKLAQFWAVAHLPHSRQRNLASSPECHASLGSHSGAERSLRNPGAQALLANSCIDLGSMKLSPQPMRLPAIMSSLAWFTERSRADWHGFRGAAIPLGPEYLDNQPGTPPPEATPQYRITFGMDLILGRCAPTKFWGAKFDHRARMLSLSWFSERSRAEPQESSSPGPPGQGLY